MSFSILSSSDLTSIDSTKYDINSTLTNKIQERVKKNAIKTIKKKTTRWKNKNDNDVIDRVSEASTSV